MDMHTLYLIVPLAPLLGAIVAGLFGKAIGRSGAHWVTILGVLVSFIASLAVYQDVMAGHVDFMFVPTSPVIPHIQAGKLRAIGIATEARVPELPDVPTMIEQGQPDFIAEQWQGLFLPSGTPSEVVSRYNSEINKILSEPEVVDRLAQLGVTKIGGSPAVLADYQRADIAKWVKVGQASKISIE